MLILLLILQSFVGSGLFSARTVTVTVTSPDVNGQVAVAYSTHLALLSTRDISGISTEYESNATIEWTGMVQGMTGNYSGTHNIKILFGSFIGKFVNFSVSAERQSISVQGNMSTVNSTVDFQAYSSVMGTVNGTIIAQDVYEHVGGPSWLIANEVWNFTHFNEQLPLT